MRNQLIINTLSVKRLFLVSQLSFPQLAGLKHIELCQVSTSTTLSPDLPEMSSSLNRDLRLPSKSSNTSNHSEGKRIHPGARSCWTKRVFRATNLMESAASIFIGTDSFICVVVVIYNLQEKRLYLHETFLTEKIPEIAASSLVRGSNAASPQSQGSIAKILQRFLNTK